MKAILFDTAIVLSALIVWLKDVQHLIIFTTAVVTLIIQIIRLIIHIKKLKDGKRDDKKMVSK